MSATDPQHPDVVTSAGDAAARNDADARVHVEPDVGRHAVSRPAPTPPHPAHDAGDERTPAPGGALRDDASVPSAPHTPPVAERTAGEVTQEEKEEEKKEEKEEKEDLFPDAHAPRTPHAGAHVLGALVGIVLAPFAVVLLLLGQSRVLEVQVDGWDASLELLGIVLVSSAALVLAVLLVLGLWSAAVPLTAGLLVTALGGLQLYAPGVARSLALDVLGGGTWDRPVALANVAGTSGTTLTVGVLLLTAGVVLALARRHGVRLGTFRERNRTV